ncbi:MAG: uracil-DNA glycosylase [Betaproteobacteria bacterium]|nr:uracil-DNA glycosylase [Betaproteobacteria bacterium]
MPIASFIDQLIHQPPLPHVFNPWRDRDPLNDDNEDAPTRRRNHLTHYLEERLGRARVLLVGEAPGYQGAKFSGCAMTSERRLLEAGPDNPFFSGVKQRTSRIRLSNGKPNPHGVLEPTASIVWPTLLGLTHSHDFVLWNTFAWHPHRPHQPLSNRTPSDTELRNGQSVLQHFLSLYPNAHVIAVGRKSEGILAQLGVSAHAVRHPAHGGATLFRQQLAAWWSANANP